MGNNVLVIAGSSEIGTEFINLLLSEGYCVFATYRTPINIEHTNLKKLRLDVCSNDDFLELFENIKGYNFRAIVNCAGCVVASPVELLDEAELSRQLDVNLFGLLRVIKNLSVLLEYDGRIINVSSMASYGVFPFISPYCISKMSCDILLRAFCNESGIKCVSVRPGVIQTKFWTEGIEQNKNNFKNFTGKYEKIGNYLVENAKKNSVKSLKPVHVAQAIFKAVCKSNPAPVINVGADSFLCAFAVRFLPEFLLNSIIKIGIEFKSR